MTLHQTSDVFVFFLETLRLLSKAAFEYTAEIIASVPLLDGQLVLRVFPVHFSRAETPADAKDQKNKQNKKSQELDRFSFSLPYHPFRVSGRPSIHEGATKDNKKKTLKLLLFFFPVLPSRSLCEKVLCHLI